MLAAAAVVLVGSAAPSAAGTLVVSGDTTIVSRLVTGVATGNPALAGNAAFFQNILGGGDRASIYTFSVVTSFPNPPLGTQLAGFYNGLPGIGASTFDGGITSGVLTGADLLVVLGRSNPFTSTETSLVRGFLFGGGNVLLTGDSDNIAFGSNALTNDLLAGIGSSIRLNQVTQGIGDQFATGSEILADPLTAGVSSFGYGRTTTVSGGTTLFLNDDGNAFIAAETFGAVPEPATWAMMLVGFGAVGHTMRRRRGVAVPASASA
jgi:hypothetical protein